MLFLSPPTPQTPTLVRIIKNAQNNGRSLRVNFSWAWPLFVWNATIVVLVWLGSCTVRTRPKLHEGVRVLTRRLLADQMDLIFYLFLTGVREVAEPSDTSTANDYNNSTPWHGLNIIDGRYMQIKMIDG